MINKRNISLASLVLLALVFAQTASAQLPSAPVAYDDTAIRETICQIIDLMEGSMGAFLTAVTGAGAVVACAFGVYRAGFGLIVVSSSSFIIHSMVSLWFAEYNCVAVSGEELADLLAVPTGGIVVPLFPDTGGAPAGGDTGGVITPTPTPLGGDGGDADGVVAPVATPLGAPTPVAGPDDGLRGDTN